MTSIIFLLAALLISLFLGSYNFLTVNSKASLSNILENLDNMDANHESESAPEQVKGPAPVKGPVSSPVSAPVSSPITNEEINKILDLYGGGK